MAGWLCSLCLFFPIYIYVALQPGALSRKKRLRRNIFCTSFSKFVAKVEIYSTPPGDYFYKNNILKTKFNDKENRIMFLQLILATIRVSDLFPKMWETETKPILLVYVNKVQSSKFNVKLIGCI